MNPFDVHGDEMPSVPPLDEAAVEALLAGRTNDAAAGDPALAAFVDDLHAAADGPAPRPTPKLAALMNEGLSTEEGELPAAAAASVTASAQQAAGLPKWRKRKMSVAELLGALGAKLAGMGMAAKAALGLGLAAATTTAAAGAGVLPDPVQHAVASVVNPVSPFDLPDGDVQAAEAEEEDPDATTSTTSTSTPSSTVPGDDDGDDGTGDEPGTAANHGACVSEAAKSAPRGPGGQHGRAVSEVARSDCGKTGDDDTTVTTAPTTTTTTDLGSASANSGPGSQNSGKGKGNGNGGENGNGNRGPGGGNAGGGRGRG